MIVHLKLRNITATGKYNVNSNELTVLKGSKMRVDSVPSIHHTLARRKESLIDDGIVKLDKRNELYLFQEDVIFKSPSMAASIIMGSGMNGYDMWKDNNGNRVGLYSKKKKKTVALF